MMSLVADYSDSNGSSTDSEESDTGDSKTASIKEIREDVKNRLPSAADLLLTNTSAKKTGEVFSNPYREAENAKTALLEKHVKMVGKDEHLTEKNGRKICWNYRKGRCRFGSNCHYAHDSDLNIGKEETTKQPSAVCFTSTKQPATTNQFLTAPNNKDQCKQQVGKRKRPGLSDTIVPGKRVMKAYQQQAQTRRTS